MKAILMSIKHKWCEKIFSGEKTIEVRKTAPKLKSPFKVYVYESIGQGEGAGAVVGEFVCEKVRAYIPFGLRGFELSPEWLEKMCLSKEQIDKYGGLKTLYGLHITAPKRYDTPKELSEFSRYGYMKIEHAGSGYVFCDNTQCGYCEPAEVIAGLYKPPVCRKGNCIVTRPPQSWMYVEEIEE